MKHVKSLETTVSLTCQRVLPPNIRPCFQTKILLIQYMTSLSNVPSDTENNSGDWNNKTSDSFDPSTSKMMRSKCVAQTQLVSHVKVVNIGGSNVVDSDGWTKNTKPVLEDSERFSKSKSFLRAKRILQNLCMVF